MKPSRRLLLVACAVLAAALGWALWPRGEKSAPQLASAPAPADAMGLAESTLRDAVVQSGAPGSTPPAPSGATSADGFVEARVFAQGKPRAGAHLRLYLRGRTDANTGLVDWRFAGAAETSADGVARIAARPGTYLAAARWGTFAPARAEFQRPSGEATTRVKLELQPGVAISGRTVQKGGEEPVPLALVTLTWEASRRPDAPAEEQVRVTSDTLGRFRAEALEPGRYRAVAQAPGYARATSRIEAPSAKEVVLELAQASFIEGRVLTAEGKPASGAEVSATGGDEQFSATATATGSFSIEVPPRSWIVTARRGDQAGRADAPVPVPTGATAREVIIRLGPASGIAGTVVVAGSKEGIAGAQVAVSPHGANGDSGRALTGAGGEFTVGGLAPGSYDVDVTAAGYLDEALRGVTVAQGQRFPLRLELRRTGAVEGSVRDSSGRAVAYALVRGAAGEARADDAGAYRLTGVAPGRGTFIALRDGSALGTTATAEVPQGGTAHLDFRLEDEGVVAGSVRRADGSPAPSGATVSIFSAAGRGSRGPGFASVPVDASGAYAATLPAGAYSLGVQGPRFGGGFRNRRFVTVEAGRTVTQDLTWSDAADPGEGFSGMVLEPDGTPSPGAMVRIAGRGGGFFSGTATDERGSFRIDRARADLPDNFDLFAFNGGRSGKASVQPEQQEATIQLQPAATLRGHLSGGGADGFHVEVTTGGGSIGPRTLQMLEFTGERFEIADVPALPVHVVVTTRDGRTAAVDVQLSPGTVQEVEIALQQLATLTGRLVDGATGQPVPEVQVSLETGTEETLSSADGRFSLPAAAGRHTLHAFAPQYRGLSKELAVEPGQALDLGDVLLQRLTAQPGTIGASLRGDSGAPPTVTFLVPQGPAETAGVLLGDQVVAVDGAKVSAVPDAIRRILGTPGTPVRLDLQRAGAALSLTVTRAP